MSQLPRIRADLLCNYLDDQVLVYDPRLDHVHLLDPTTALVLKFLKKGEGTARELTLELARAGDGTSGEALFDLAIQELSKADLIEEVAPLRDPVSDLSRRELLRKLTLAGAAALVPAIITLSPSRTYGQVGSCLAKKECCTVNEECCSGKCDASTGTGCTTGPLECH